LGRVLDSKNGSAPVEDVRVSCADTGFEEPRRFGITSTNREGYYRIEFTILEGTEDPYPLEFTFTHPELSAPEVETINFDPEAKVPVSKSFDFTTLPSTSSTIASTGITVPTDVQTYLASQSITITLLEDIRRLGGLKNLPVKFVDTGNADLLKLDGLASLELVQDDLSKNNTLYSRGYETITDIALTPRATFVEENTDLFNDYGAASIHVAAKAGHMLGVNVLASEVAPMPQHDGEAQSSTGGASSCDCPDCKSGVSPLAYLTDLVQFSYRNVLYKTSAEGSEQAAGIGFLISRFHQNISAMRVTCSQLKERYCQNRIATEVMRSYVSDNEPSGPYATALAEAEKEYLVNTYYLLLDKLGTSYAELRRLRGTNDQKAKQRWADRLGIVLDFGGQDTLLELLIDLSDLANIVEGKHSEGAKGLEELFGLRDTNRSVLNTTPDGKVEIWKRARLRSDWAKEDGFQDNFWQTDHEVRDVIIDPDVVTVDDLRNPEVSDPAFVLWEKRFAFIQDELNAQADAVITAQAQDVFAADRLVIAYGGELEPEDTELHYVNGGFSADWTIVEHFIANGNTYFRVQEEIASDQVNGSIELTGLVTHVNAPSVPSVTGLLTRLCTDQVEYDGEPVAIGWDNNPAVVISTLRDAVPSALIGDSSALAQISGLALDLGAAQRLLALIDKNAEDPNKYEPAGNLSSDEWDEFKNILVQVAKRRLSEPGGIWRTEEDLTPPQDPNPLLGPAYFRQSITEPREGQFPLTSQGLPSIDPDSVGTIDLPEVTARSVSSLDALALLETRKIVMLASRISLATAHGLGWQELLDLAFEFGSSEGPVWDSEDLQQNDYFKLLNQLGDPQWKTWAALFIAERLRLKEEELRTIVTLGTKENGGTALTAGEKDQLYRILLHAHKLIVLYPAWLNDEENNAYWKLRKAALPKWRATRAQRDAWLKALAEHSERPIIDADLIGPADMRMPVASDPAFILFDARWKEMHGNDSFPSESGSGGWLNFIEEYEFFTEDGTIEFFDELTKKELGHAEASLAAIHFQQEDGVDIRPRVAQLTLTPTEFNQLMTYRNLTEAESNSLTVEEKTNLKRILATVQKRRKFYIYRQEEIAAGISLTPDHFKLYKPALISFPPDPERRLEPWLAEDRHLSSWRSLLRGRIDQEKSTLEAWHEALFEVDDAMMVHLRDALVLAAGSNGKGLLWNARNLGDKLLIDLENNCCYKTNRVAVAIETVQQFLWKIRTGAILTHYPWVRYQGDDFDEAWTWMGSYANWRAAMFVFLYPENVLHPSLRKNQTPGFRDVVQATRNNRRFGPGNACEVAYDYRSYISDVANLDLKCSVQADTCYEGGQCGAADVLRRRTFLFAQSRGNFNAYYSLVDTSSSADVKQAQFWTRVPGMAEDTRIFGCDVFHPGKDKFVYLFFTRADQEKKNVFFALRFDLLNGRWEDEPLEFDVEEDALQIVSQSASGEYVNFKREDFSTDILSAAVRRIDAAWRPPMIAVSLKKVSGYAKDAYTFYWTMSDNGKEFKPRWTNDGWQLIIDENRTFRGEVKYYLGLAVGEGAGYDDYNRSIFVLETETGTQLTNAWQVWRAQLTALENLLLQYPPSGMFAHVHYYIKSLIATKLNEEPYPKYIDVQGERVSNVIRLHVGGKVGGGHAVAYSFTSLPTASVVQAFPFFSNGGCAVSRKVGNSTPTTYLITQDGDEVLVPDFALPNETIAYSRTAMEWQPQDGNPAYGLQVWQKENDYREVRLGTTAHLMWSGASASYVLESPISLLLTPRLGSLPVIGLLENQSEYANQSLLSSLHFNDNSGSNLWLTELLNETYYFVPMQIALQLHANGHYQAALDWFRSVYDFRAQLPLRKISYLLRQEENVLTNAERLHDWYADPLNPHAIAGMRRHTYTRYTILSIVNCLLDYADAQFTTDNSETVPRARELYEDALALLKLVTPSSGCPIDNATGLISEHEVAKAWVPTWQEALERLEPLTNTAGFGALLTSISEVMSNSDPMAEQLADVNALIDTALAAHEPDTIEDVLNDHETLMAAATASALGSIEADVAVQQLIQQSVSAFDHTMTAVTGLPTAELEVQPIAWLVDDRAASGFGHGHAIEYISPGKEHVINDYTSNHPAQGYNLNNPFPNVWLSGISFGFCVVPNPMVRALVMKAEVELWKIHNCMNIAGMVRELDPFAAPTDSTTGIPVIGAGGGSIAIPTSRDILPSPYRYRVIVERTRQLVGMAQQVEAAFLATLEKLDAERYSQLRAEQDIETSKANIKLQDLKIKEADNGVTLAGLQRDRAGLQVTGLQGMIDAGLLSSERTLQDLYGLLALHQGLQAAANTATQLSGFMIQAASASQGVNPYAAAAGVAAAVSASTFALGSLGFELATITIGYNIQLSSLNAAFERRKQEWEFQLTLANQDVKIGDQQIKLAQDRVRIVGQEREIAVLQNEHARATLDFLKNKFTSAELYEWMSRVLEDAYSWFLQEATAMAQLAQRQLAFERQLDLPPFIRTDYWIVDGGSMGGVDMTGQGAVDRRGLTGSTRLLKDLTELDQAAFSTNSPKLQLTKTMALSELAPEELLNLRTMGLANFMTTQEMFDRDYPGHYLRLIKKVSVTVIALTPPTKGIRATLSNGGTSSVVTGGPLFQNRIIARYPETIALSSGVGDSGLFPMHAEGEFLHPFEGSGVQTAWEFRMEKTANPFDFNSIADVLFTIEYEALHDTNYRKALIRQLDDSNSAALAVSMKNNLPDQWFDLHNPTTAGDHHLVTFQISQRDMAPNISPDYTITRAVAYAIMKDGSSLPFGIYLSKSEPNADPGQRSYIQFANTGIAILPLSTLGSSTGDGPKGTWHIGFGPASGASLVTDPFAEKLVDDIFILFTYNGIGTPYLA